MRKLEEYPTAIALVQDKVANFRDLIERAKWRASILESEADIAVANNKGLPNDAARKAQKASLLLADDYQVILAEIVNLEAELNSAVTQLELLKNEFKVARIQALSVLASVPGLIELTS